MLSTPCRGGTPPALLRAILVSLLVLAAWQAEAAPAATIAAGERQSCGIFDGTVRCWGQDTSGALGFVTDSPGVPYATRVGAPIRGATHVVGTWTGNGGSGHFCAVAGGAAWCWGPNPSGAVGTGTTDAPVPVPVRAPALAAGVTMIDKNASRTCGVSDGAAWCLGASLLGDGSKDNSPLPRAVLGMGAGVTDIAAGWRSSCVLQNGAVYCWGASIHGQLGGPRDSATPTTPVPLPGPASAIDAGQDSACAVVSGGVWCWGSNGGGRLGTGDLALTGATPLNVAGLPAGSGIVDIAGNATHYCALRADGAVLCWGDNRSGKVGNATTSGTVLAPVPVQGLPGPATSIAVGRSHSCAAVGKDYYCWGSNSGGQLGNGTVGGESGVAVKVRMPPKAAVTRPSKPVKVNRARKAALATVSCPVGTGTCAVTVPQRVTVRLKGVAYRLAIAKVAPIAPGAKAVVVATLPAGLHRALVGASVKVTVPVTVTNHGGTLTRRVVVTVRR